MNIRTGNLLIVVAGLMLLGLLVAGCATGTPAITSPARGEESQEVAEPPESENPQTPEASLETSPQPTSDVVPDRTPEATTDSTQGLQGESTPAVTPAVTPESTAESTPESGASLAPGAPALTRVTLFLGFIPNVQFAPVYVALERGYFREAGIDLTIEHGFDETDGLTRIGTGNLQFGIVSGEQVLLARAGGAPVRYVYRWYQRFPVGIVSPASANLTTPDQLRGKVVGLPGLYGASYIGLRALLHEAGLQETDLGRLEAIGFDSAPAMCGGQVEASVVYIANEPAQIEAMCFPVSVLAIADYANLVSNGLVTNEATIESNPDLVRSMVAAFNRGLEATIADPAEAYRHSRAHVENLAEDDPLQRAVLDNSIALWQANRPGFSDADTWQRSADTLIEMGLIEGAIDVAAAYTNEYLP